LNYGRALGFTTAPSHAAVISVDCSFDILQSDTGAHLATHLLETCTYFIHRLLVNLADIPTDIIRLPPHFYRPITNDVETLPATTLPTAIIPLLTPYAPELSAYLSKRGINAVPVVFPAVPRDQPRIRVTMNADKTRDDVDKFVDTMVEWAKTMDPCGAGDKAIRAVELQSSKL
jgi:8-amino-7-oxononanoate synthase